MSDKTLNIYLGKESKFVAADTNHPLQCWIHIKPIDHLVMITSVQQEWIFRQCNVCILIHFTCTCVFLITGCLITVPSLETRLCWFHSLLLYCRVWLQLVSVKKTKKKKPIKTCRHFDAEQVVLQTHTFSC